jgi:hypothetical protein
MLVNLRDTTLRGSNRDQCVGFEDIPDRLSQQRVLSKLGGNDHPRPPKEFLRWLGFGWVWVDELIRKRDRV